MSKLTDRKEQDKEDNVLVSKAMRPEILSNFIGQKEVVDNLSVFIKSSTKRKDSMDHVLFYGPPGLGKTTLASIIAKELNVGFKATSGPVINKSGDLAAVLTSLEENDVLFIDEIHRLPSSVEEILYPAMEDFHLDIIIGEGPSAKSIRVDLAPFTLVAATTRAGLITTPLRERFGIPLHMQFYKPDDLKKIVLNNAKKLNLEMSEEGANEIALRSRGTPRVAVRLLRRVRDFAEVRDKKIVDKKITDHALLKMDIDSNGLDKMDRNYLSLLAKNYNGGPAGVETISAALGNEKDIIEDVVEPFLIQIGLIQRTPRGRVLTQNGWSYLGIKIMGNNAQEGLKF